MPNIAAIIARPACQPTPSPPSNSITVVSFHPLVDIILRLVFVHDNQKNFYALRRSLEAVLADRLH